MWRWRVNDELAALYSEPNILKVLEVGCCIRWTGRVERISDNNSAYSWCLLIMVFAAAVTLQNVRSESENTSPDNIQMITGESRQCRFWLCRIHCGLFLTNQCVLARSNQPKPLNWRTVSYGAPWRSGVHEEITLLCRFQHTYNLTEPLPITKRLQQQCWIGHLDGHMWGDSKVDAALRWTSERAIRNHKRISQEAYQTERSNDGVQSYTNLIFNGDFKTALEDVIRRAELNSTLFSKSDQFVCFAGNIDIE